MKKKIVVMLSLVLCLMLSISLAACSKNKHEAKSEWKFDAAQHWHECATKGHEDKLDVADHTWNEGKITTDPTETTEGVRTYTCTVCKTTKTESEPKLSQKDNTITVDKISFTYNAKSQPIDSLVTADNKAEMVIKYVGVDGTTYEESTTAPTNAGTYQYTITIPATEEWNAAEVSGKFTIAKYELTVLYEKTHTTKEYDGNAMILVEYKSLEGTDVNIVIFMKSKDVGTEIDRIQLPGLLKDNYTYDQSKVKAEIVAKKLANLKFEIAEDDVKLELSEQTIEREIAGANGEKVIVEITFDPEELDNEDALDLSFDGKGGATCIIKFKTATPNYVLDLNLGELKLVRPKTA